MVRMLVLIAALLLAGCQPQADSKATADSAPSPFGPASSTSTAADLPLPPVVLPTPDGWKSGSSSDPGTPA